jgi:hypothetical protein
MNFGSALEILKHGGQVARSGWNGRGMFVYLVPYNSYPAQTAVAKAHFGEGALVPYHAYLALVGVDGAVSTWAPSVGDALAEDWYATEESPVVSRAPASARPTRSDDRIRLRSRGSHRGVHGITTTARPAPGIQRRSPWNTLH